MVYATQCVIGMNREVKIIEASGFGYMWIKNAASAHYKLCFDSLFGKQPALEPKLGQVCQLPIKAADVVGLYPAPLGVAIVISIDEKMSMQVLSRIVGHVKTQDGATMRPCKSTYRCSGTFTCLVRLI